VDGDDEDVSVVLGAEEGTVVVYDCGPAPTGAAGGFSCVELPLPPQAIIEIRRTEKTKTWICILLFTFCRVS